jgi:hypothetical protein
MRSAAAVCQLGAAERRRVSARRTLRDRAERHRGKPHDLRHATHSPSLANLSAQQLLKAFAWTDMLIVTHAAPSAALL